MKTDQPQPSIDLRAAASAKAVELAAVYGADAMFAANAGLSVARAFDDTELAQEWTEIATVLHRITTA